MGAEAETPVSLGTMVSTIRFPPRLAVLRTFVSGTFYNDDLRPAQMGHPALQAVVARKLAVALGWVVSPSPPSQTTRPCGGVGPPAPNGASPFACGAGIRRRTPRPRRRLKSSWLCAIWLESVERQERSRDEVPAPRRVEKSRGSITYKVRRQGGRAARCRVRVQESRVASQESGGRSPASPESDSHPCCNLVSQDDNLGIVWHQMTIPKRPQISACQPGCGGSRTPRKPWMGTCGIPRRRAHERASFSIPHISSLVADS